MTNIKASYIRSAYCHPTIPLPTFTVSPAWFPAPSASWFWFGKMHLGKIMLLLDQAGLLPFFLLRYYSEPFRKQRRIPWKLGD